MKIIELQAENVKRLLAIELHPAETGLIEVSGENGAGKSCVLDSIEMCLGGEKSIPGKPVRRGADKARIVVDLGDLIVTRTITPDGGGTFRVQDKDMQRQSSPQELLDKLRGKLTFDPLEFKKQNPEKRAETLRVLLGLDFKTEDGRIKAHYDERTEVNRQVKKLEALVQGQKEYPDAPKEEISAQEVLDEQRKATETNSSNAECRRMAAMAKMKHEEMRDDIDGLAQLLEESRKKVADLEKALKEGQDNLAAAERAMNKLQEQAADMKDIDLSPFRDKLKQLEADNSKVRSNKVKADLRAELKTQMAAADKLTRNIEAIEAAKKEKMLAAKFPIAGLSISDANQVEFNGIPFEQVNTAEQLRISVAMAMAMNPQLRILLIRQGNDLDDKGVALISKMAVENDFQIWLERVKATGETAIIIEDGSVKGTIPGTIEPKEEPKETKHTKQQESLI